MKKTDYNTIMKEEIEKRLRSSAWNFQMAAAVLEKRGSRSRRFPALFSLASAAVLATVLVVFWFMKEPAGMGGYEQFLSLQVKGTYDDVFDRGLKNTASPDGGGVFIANQVSETYRDVFRKDRDASTGKTGGAELISATDVDSLIDDVLAIR